MDARIAIVALALLAGTADAFDHAHPAWDQLLRKHVVVHEGVASRLDYGALAQERLVLDGYLDSLSQVSQAEFGAWTREQRMAFLINAYNAFMVAKVLTRYPGIRSVWDFGKVFGNPFKDRFFILLGKESTLDDIEHGLLRPYAEPRVHFALNCASVGCPMLREEAYVAHNLEAQLDSQARRFLSDRSRNRVKGGRLELSKIFDWYREDFAPLGAFLARYGLPGTGPIDFLEYDWTLNDSRSSSRR